MSLPPTHSDNTLFTQNSRYCHLPGKLAAVSGIGQQARAQAEFETKASSHPHAEYQEANLFHQWVLADLLLDLLC